MIDLSARHTPRLSPSGYDTFANCERKWWFEKVVKVPREQTPAQELGIAVHAAVEGYLGGDPLPDTTAGDIVRHGVAPLGLDALRDSPYDVHLERRFQRPTGAYGAAIPTYCVADVVVLPNKENPGAPQIIDHKTTKNVNAPWLPNSRALARNSQLLWYAFLAFEADKPDTFEVRHLYYQTQGKRAYKVVNATATWEAAEDNAKRYIAASHRMSQHVKAKDQTEVPTDTSACGAFGGCRHAAYCTIKPENEVRGLVGFRDRLRARANGAAPPPPTNGAGPAATPTNGAATPTNGAGAPQAVTVVPPDSPGTDVPTRTQLDEIAEVLRRQAPPLETISQITKFLTTKDGVRHLLFIGLAVRHANRIARYVVDGEYTPGRDLPPATPEPQIRPDHGPIQPHRPTESADEAFADLVALVHQKDKIGVGDPTVVDLLGIVAGGRLDERRRAIVDALMEYGVDCDGVSLRWGGSDPDPAAVAPRWSTPHADAPADAPASVDAHAEAPRAIGELVALVRQSGKVSVTGTRIKALLREIAGTQRLGKLQKQKAFAELARYGVDNDGVYLSVSNTVAAPVAAPAAAPAPVAPAPAPAAEPAPASDLAFEPAPPPISIYVNCVPYWPGPRPLDDLLIEVGCDELTVGNAREWATVLAARPELAVDGITLRTPHILGQYVAQIYPGCRMVWGA